MQIKSYYLLEFFQYSLHISYTKNTFYNFNLQIKISKSMRSSIIFGIFACLFALSQALSLRAPDAGIVRLPVVAFPHTGKNVSSLRAAHDDANDDFLSVFPKIQLQEKQRKH